MENLKNHHEAKSKHHENSHNETKMMHTNSLNMLKTEHDQFKNDTLNESSLIANERDELLIELNEISKILDNERIKNYNLENTLKNSDTTINKEIKKRNMIIEQLNDCKNEIHNLQNKLNENQVRM